MLVCPLCHWALIKDLLQIKSRLYKQDFRRIFAQEKKPNEHSYRNILLIKKQIFQISIWGRAHLDLNQVVSKTRMKFLRHEIGNGADRLS